MRNKLEEFAHAPAPMGALRARLAREGSARKVVDALYRALDTPIGPVTIFATPAGVVRLAFSGETGAVEEVARLVGPRVFGVGAGPEAGAPPRTDAQAAAPADPSALAVLERAAAELGEYFARGRRQFEVPVDLRLGGFRGEVVRALERVGYGQRVTYKELAQRVGNPGAIRAVGSACAHNPVPIFLPCHRVVRSDGTWGRYRGGEAAKTFLLRMEAAAA